MLAASSNKLIGMPFAMGSMPFPHPRVGKATHCKTSNCGPCLVACKLWHNVSKTTLLYKAVPPKWLTIYVFDYFQQDYTVAVAVKCLPNEFGLSRSSCFKIKLRITEDETFSLRRPEKHDCPLFAQSKRLLDSYLYFKTSS